VVRIYDSVSGQQMLGTPMQFGNDNGLGTPLPNLGFNTFAVYPVNPSTPAATEWLIDTGSGVASVQIQSGVPGLYRESICVNCEYGPAYTLLQGQTGLAGFLHQPAGNDMQVWYVAPGTQGTPATNQTLLFSYGDPSFKGRVLSRPTAASAD
jgi:hypothetical protein